ncbi:MAG: L-rhamnose mutarotase [Kiritimatiellaeota bacterium]|nr:L-rhamnose mutarotase [Kiritimatiellota bacterium]
MIRKAFVMTVNAGSEKEYERRHNPIWAELEATLKQHGAHNYSIFLLPGTRQLFGYVEIEDEARWNAIAKTASCQKWWAHMRDVMAYNADEVFHLA